MYLDPGFGGMLVQIIVAVVAAGGAIAFAMRRKIKNLFSKKKDDNTQEAATFSNEPTEDVIDMMEEDKDK